MQGQTPAVPLCDKSSCDHSTSSYIWPNHTMRELENGLLHFILLQCGTKGLTFILFVRTHSLGKKSLLLLGCNCRGER